MSSKWVLYILECGDKTLYTGITNNLEKRLQAPRDGSGAKYTRGRTPLVLRYLEDCESQSQALKREYAVKQLSREEKLALCNTYDRSGGL